MSLSHGVVCLSYAGYLFDREVVASRAGVGRQLTDGQLLAALWTRLGDRCPEQAEGTLTAILWDDPGRRLLLLRDRLGLRPLVYGERANVLAVGAEAAPVLGRLAVEPRPSTMAMVAHLHGYPPPSGETFYDTLREVPAGEWVEVRSESLHRHRYWRPEPGPPLASGERPEAIRQALDRAVDDNVPREAFVLTLSGGLDTPSIAASLRRIRPDAPLRAITWSFDELPRVDETGKARAVGERLDLEHHLLAADRWWPLSSPSGIETHFESPFAHFYKEVWDHTFEWCRERGIDVVVTGAGGDHLFGFGGVGAYAYPDLLLTGRWLELMRQLKAHRRVSSASLPRILEIDLLRPLWHTVRGALGRAPRTRRPGWLGETARAVGWRIPAPEPAGWVLPGRRHRLGVLRHRSVGQFGIEMSRLASPHGLELRHPMLDHRLFDLAARLPGTASYRAGYHKQALRNAMRDLLPEPILTERVKTVPTDLFHRGARERETAKIWALLHDMQTADMGLVDEARVRHAYQGYLEGDDDFSFWRAASLEDWLRRHS